MVEKPFMCKIYLTWVKIYLNLCVYSFRINFYLILTGGLMLNKKSTLLRSVIFLVIFIGIILCAEADMSLMFEELQRPVYDLEFSDLNGILMDGLIFALPGMEAGIAYYTLPHAPEIYSIATNLGAVSVTANDADQKILAAMGCGSNSDGLWEFDLDTHEFELIGYYFNPRFIKHLDSGYYMGYGLNELESGMIYSADGEEWGGSIRI